MVDTLGEAALPTSSLVELAVDRLRREILAGALAPGDRLVEEQITRRFGISRAPLREALRLLAQQGLVEHQPRRGVRVATLSDGDVDELFALRDVLERHALEHALPLTAGAAAGLHEQHQAMRRAATGGDAYGLATAHRRFHLELVATAGRRHLLLAYEPILLKLQLHMAVNLRRESEHATAEDSLRRHAALLEAVESGDPTRALNSLSGHGARTYLR